MKGETHHQSEMLHNNLNTTSYGLGKAKPRRKTLVRESSRGLDRIITNTQRTIGVRSNKFVPANTKNCNHLPVMAYQSPYDSQIIQQEG